MKMPSMAAAALVAVSGLSLSACDNTANYSTETSSAKAGSKDAEISAPVAYEWRRVYAAGDETRWRCAGSTLLIQGSADLRSGLSAIAHDERCATR